MTRLAPGLLIAAPRSGSGKTTVALGLMRAFRRRGLRVAAAKAGPDYIDPAFHAAATGRPAVNLDTMAMGDRLLDGLAAEAAAEADLVLVEGAMGLFDGAPGLHGRTGAAAELAIRFGWPVLLVLDAAGQGQTAGAVALGCARFDPGVAVAGIVLNQVAGARHRAMAEAGLDRAGLRVFGALARDPALALPSRHLGLVQAGEFADLEERLERLADAVEAGMDLDALRDAARGPRLDGPPGPPPVALPPPGRRVALAQDAAFTFLYPHVAAAWRRSGTELVPFSPLADEAPPERCDACWLPGGYPELHAGRLAGARTFLDGLRRFAATRPVHGECGGYMVLGRSLRDADGTLHAMANLLPVETSLVPRRLHLGYRIATLLAAGPLGPAGARIAGHEFHYASVVEGAADGRDAVATVTDAGGTPLGSAGHRRGLVSGTFFHAIAARPD